MSIAADGYCCWRRWWALTYEHSLTLRWIETDLQRILGQTQHELKILWKLGPKMCSCAPSSSASSVLFAQKIRHHFKYTRIACIAVCLYCTSAVLWWKKRPQTGETSRAHKDVALIKTHKHEGTPNKEKQNRNIKIKQNCMRKPNARNRFCCWPSSEMTRLRTISCLLATRMTTLWRLAGRRSCRHDCAKINDARSVTE